ncbi:NAD(P)H-binding protein [Rhodococcus koreensis]|jgi:hypothetical protein|uniref:NAD(P)H-binding protein n=1 Tax=Rhodococcus koreensis TaxID=99653 RepID=UPI001F1274C2|nr:NAD(P)H-binding protein [Rhodococcus koreensis]
MVHRDDGRVDALREWGADIVVGDLTRPAEVAAALRGVTRVFFNMSVSADYLEAAAVVCEIADERGDLEVVNMSQMTVSQMTSTSTEESRHQRLHWLAEHLVNWSGLPWQANTYPGRCRRTAPRRPRGRQRPCRRPRRCGACTSTAATGSASDTTAPAASPTATSW